jgi:hypothetical protein
VPPWDNSIAMIYPPKDGFITFFVLASISFCRLVF